MLTNQQRETIKKLESMVMRRFDSITEINSFLKDKFGVQCPVDKKTRYDDESELDFCLIGNLDKGEIFCDFDLYYLKDNANKFYITEVGYTFE